MSKVAVLVTLGLLLVGCETRPPVRVGQRAHVQFGTVRTAEPVRLDSDAGKGALIGGALGLASSGGSVRNSILGAAVGGAATAAVQGDRNAMAYTVELANGAMLRIVSDQQQIRPGDCVAIERVGQTNNIRREWAGYCERSNQAAVNSVSRSSQRLALQCEAAKAELVRAQTPEAADLASEKISLLCDGAG